MSLRGEHQTKERFVQYMASNPAVRRGWVSLDADGEAITVADEYVEPFREIAANFGLEASPAGPPEVTG